MAAATRAIRALKRWWLVAFIAAYFRQQLRDAANQALRTRDKFEVLLLGAAAVLARRVLGSLLSYFEENGIMDLVKSVAYALSALVPGVRKKVEGEMDKMMLSMEKEIHGHFEGQRVEALPPTGIAKAELQAMMASRAATDEKYWDTGKHSGTVYLSAATRKDLRELHTQAMGLFANANPLHFDSYPMLRQMEAEIVSMTLKLVNGGPDACGCTTYGGTESILLAVKAMRDRAASRGVTEPNLIIATSAHAAFNKAGLYFKIAVRSVPILENGEIDVRQVRRKIDSNTIGLVGSAPNFPQGTIDPIPVLAELARKHDIGLHVDACLGSYVVVMLEKIGRDPTYQFDFRVDGVTSMSMDTHKYGLSTKGSSVLMYASTDWMHYQYAAVPKWSGGMYITPTLGGSRTGAGIAAAWASMLHIGEDRYREFARVLVEAKDRLVAGVGALPDILRRRLNNFI
jgi:sphinganine-1-phosphate aldolase